MTPIDNLSAISCVVARLLGGLAENWRASGLDRFGDDASCGRWNESAGQGMLGHEDLASLSPHLLGLVMARPRRTLELGLL